MAISDPIADALTKVRNASRARHATVEVRASKFTTRILDVLKKEGYIKTYKPVGEQPSQRALRVYLKHAPKKGSAIIQIKRVSRPGIRVYRKASELPRVLGGLGTVIISTSKGLMTEREAYKQKIGGEVICSIW